MIEVKRIIPECNADTLLVELIMQRGKPGHRNGKTEVLKALEEFDDDTRFIIGLIDSDKFKRTYNYCDEFTITREDKVTDQGLLIKQHSNSNKYLIFVCPAFEKWILQLAEENGINPSDYGYDSFESLCNASKRNEIREDKDFKKFVNAVIQKNPPAIATLKRWFEKVFE